MKQTIDKKLLLREIRPYLFMLVVSYVLIIVMIVFSAWMKLSDFIQYQEKIANSLASGTATEITLLVRDLEHRIESFTRHYADQLAALSDDLKNDEVKKQLMGNLKEDIPEAFTFTLANIDGTPLLTEFKNPVAKGCQATIRRYAKSHRNIIEFHPGPVTNHFDVMRSFTDRHGHERIFFASFSADILVPLLNRHELPGYQAYITSVKTPDIIDIAPAGPRQALQDANLSEEDVRRINARIDIPGTSWQIIMVPGWSVYKDEIFGVAWRVALSLVVITLIALAMLRILIRHQTSQHRSEQYYQQLFHANKAPMMMIDPDTGIVIDANEAAERFYGYHSPLKGQHVSVISKLPANEVEQRLQETKRGEKDHFFSQHRLANGETRDVEIHSGPIQFDGQTIIYSIINDITARKQAERALIESELRFKTLTNLSPVGTFFTDEAGICIYVNKAWTTITGIDEDHWIGKTWTDAIHEQDREKIISDWARLVLKHSDYLVEGRIQRPDGEVRWVLCRAASIPDYAGISDMYIGTATDITDRKKSEHELRLLATSFEAYEPIIITDADARILRVNKAFLNTTGYTEEEVLGKNPSMFSAGERDEEFYRDMWQQLKTQGNWTGEFVNRSKNGQVHHDWVSITALKDDRGNIINFIGHYQDITERKKAEEQIRRLAYYDPLTNLPNRRMFLERLDQELQIARNEHKFSALLFLDLDHFKNLNDSLGHPVGDDLLIEVSNRLQQTRSKGEIIARIGGDEFVILLPDLADSMEELSNVAAHRAKEATRVITEPYYLQGHEYHITVSIGIDLFPDDNEDSFDILKRADTAMYRAKQAGRNTICFFEQEMQVSADRRLSLEKDLRHAIAQNELFLVYQPMVDRKGVVVGAEALLRWQHTKVGTIPPADFIPIAEDTGMIFEISEWILHQVCQQFIEWKNNDVCPDLKNIAINLSPRQFSQPGFERKTMDIIAQYDTDPSSIEFEITEGMVLNNLENSVKRMSSMKKKGFRFSVDDFGTGYSSLAYLRQLPVNRLKIDRSFVSDISGDDSHATIVETIISMGHHLGLEVVAEGVETEEQHNFLQKNACDIYQGYYFSRPVPPEAFVEIRPDQKVISL